MTARRSGDDTVPPAVRDAVTEIMRNVAASWRVSPPEMNTVRSESTEAVHALWAQVAEDVDAWTETWLAAHPVATARSRAGDTAPDDEEVRMVELALRCAETGEATHWPTAAAFLAQEIHRLRSEVADLMEVAQRAMDRLRGTNKSLRSEVAALRAAGDELAREVEERDTPYGPLAREVQAWRSAAGSPATEGGDQP